MPNPVEPVSSATGPRPVAPYKEPYKEPSGTAPAPNFIPHFASSVEESTTPQPEPAVAEFGLSNLREQLKSVMIPLLIKIFVLKGEAIQARNPPTRLQNQSELSTDDVREKLL